VKEVISTLDVAVLPGGKYLLRIAFGSVFHVVKKIHFILQPIIGSILQREREQPKRYSKCRHLIGLITSHFIRKLRRCTL